ncbi:WD40 repeat protein [Mangrovibacterium marinum]|uniref:WD40 repeat protein n=1 Tax=Mangrovibacterium marinum TaxID=1639118 RepID=A0A2T5BZ03_9BACT|nr:OmpA family protein [Mangrovibacterium marinum]PTN07481.1 WD40 repeat protein [Mangrovibacterium marinum]
MKVRYLTGLALMFVVLLGNAQTQKVFDDVQIDIKNASVNTAKSDFASYLYGQELIYNSEVKVEGDKKKESYLMYDVYSTQLLPEGQTAKKGEHRSRISTKIQEGPMTICEATGEMYLTQSYEEETDVKNIVFKKENIRLCITRFEKAGDDWKEVGPFPFASKDYSVAHPTVSSTGDTLIFISDMPGGAGGTDLYYTIRKGEEWTDPVNLKKLNTAGNEMFPYWDADGTLYFASNGRDGQGGLDIYYTSLNGLDPADILTFNNAINSAADDFGFIPGPAERYAYFSSNRSGGQGADDIYVVLPEEYKFNLLVISSFTDKPVAGVKVEIKNEKGKVVAESVTDASGHTPLKAEMGKRYDLLATKAGYYDKTKEISLVADAGFVNKEEVLYIDPSHRLRGQVVNIFGDEPIAGATITIAQDGKAVDSATTDAEGNFKADIQPEHNYLVTAEADNFFGTDVEFSTQGMEPGELFYYFQLYPLDAGTRIGLTNIYFDYDKYNIRPDAVRVLDRMAETLAKYPDIDIKLEAHTDCRGTDEYNQKLSERRAKATLDYLVRKGIDKSRIEAIGFGETQLVNECADDVDCSEEKHQENRRTVFEIKKSKITPKASLGK